MGKESGKFSILRESSYRVTILVVVTAWHLGLLVLLLRPAIYHRDTTPVVGNDPLVLKLRFLQAPHLAPPARRSIAPAVHSHATRSASSSKPPTAQRAAQVDAQQHETRLIGALKLDTSEEDSANDGGFQERLQYAQHFRSVHGVPGSDMHVVSGIRLIDPMSQGIGAVMRTAQRAFGVKNIRCIDVDVWRQLTPQELSARHVSPNDEDKVDERYGCNKPSGLHF